MGEELKQTVPGVISCVTAPVVITSDKTPEPGVGSVVSSLPASAVLAVVLVYKVTHAACDVSILYKANPLAVEIDTFAAALLAIDCVTCAVFLDCNPTLATSPHPILPAPSPINACPMFPLVVG